MSACRPPGAETDAHVFRTTVDTKMTNSRHDTNVQVGADATAKASNGVRKATAKDKTVVTTAVVTICDVYST